MTHYRCPTLGDCERANAGEIFERAAGEDLKCPECGTLLETHPAAGAGSGRPARSKAPVVIVGVAAALFVAAGGGWLAMSKPAQATSLAAVAATAPADAITVAAPAPSTSTGLAPSEAELARLKQDGHAALVRGQAAQAEASSAAAAANEMVKLGIAKLAQGKLDDAVLSFKQAQDIAPKQPHGYYNMAIARFRQGNGDDAMKELEAAFMVGFTEFAAMDQDRDLDGLRSDPRFAGLVARYRAAK